MPRPGPRPYVRERRAWHTDRHQPIRGSLIRQIFRVVNEVHSSTTKKNKEWQLKLPVVVLKAEEIMYSKANSEAEYVDLKTLWDRTNDAINTIIRRDESTETGQLLQPCIEAALNLGCTPRRTSRSQRNCTPRCYLNQFTQQVENSAPGNLSTNSHCVGSYSGFMKPATMNVADIGSESQKHIVQNSNCTTNKLPFASGNASLSYNQCLSIHSCHLSMYSVYPLCNGNQLKCEEVQPGFEVFPKLISNMVETAKMGVTNNIFSSDVDSSEKMNQTYVRDTSNNTHESECDLSLRLGPLSVPPQEIEDKKFCDDPIDNRDNPMNSSSIICSIEGKYMNVDATMRKRKMVYNPPVNQQFCSPAKFPLGHLTRRMKSAGS